MRSPTPLDMVRRRWPEGTPETPAPAPRPESPPDRMLSAQRRCSQKRRAIGILLGPQLGGDRSILRGEWCRNSQPRTASRSPSPTCHARTLPTLRNTPAIRSPAPSPTPPHQGPPSPAKNSTTGLTPRVLTTLSLFRASSRTQTTDVEVVPHRTPRSVLAPSNGPKPCNSLQLLRLQIRQMGLTGC